MAEEQELPLQMVPMELPIAATAAKVVNQTLVIQPKAVMAARALLY
jgi:hypothetical protein